MGIVRSTEFSWYVWFWLGMGIATVTPIYVLLFLIWRELRG